MSGKPDFDEWIRVLDEDVIQDEYGYEDGEFAIFPELWRGMFDGGLTPAAAFRRALDAHDEARKQEEADRQANWERIQREDAEAVARYRSTKP